MLKCPKCEKEYEKLENLARHTGRMHKMKTLDLWIHFNGKRPSCACGCGEETKFLNVIQGFREYKRGHISRIKNPHIYRTKDSFEKISKTRIDMHEKGELSAWNKGLTKRDDSRIEFYSSNGSKTIRNNKEEIKKRSERMKKNRLSGTVPTLYGENSSQWKGGTSSVSSRCHGNTRLYQEWKYPRLKESGFSCQRCASTDRLEVHHDEEKMSEIIHLMTERLNPEKKDDFDLQTDVMSAVIDYHIDKNVSGEVICHECHKEEHPSYNYKK